MLQNKQNDNVTVYGAIPNGMSCYFMSLTVLLMLCSSGGYWQEGYLQYHNSQMIVMLKQKYNR